MVSKTGVGVNVTVQIRKWVWILKARLKMGSEKKHILVMRVGQLGYTDPYQNF